MKKISLLVVALLMVVTSFAHYLQPSTDRNACAVKGYVEIAASNFTYTGSSLDSIYLFITKTGNSNVSVSNPVLWDTAFFINSTAFNFYAKLFSSPENLFVKEYTRSTKHSGYSLEWENYNSDGTMQSFSGAGVIISSCSVLPVTGLSSLSFSINENVVELSWTTTQETNNNYFVVQGSTDGKTWVSIGTVNSYWPGGNGSTSHDYSYSFNDDADIEAGIGGVIGLILLIGMLGSFLERKKWKSVLSGMALLIVSLLVFSCTKTNSKKQIGNLKYNDFRVQQFDLDGNVHYSQIVII